MASHGTRRLGCCLGLAGRCKAIESGFLVHLIFFITFLSNLSTSIRIDIDHIRFDFLFFEKHSTEKRLPGEPTSAGPLRHPWQSLSGCVFDYNLTDSSCLQRSYRPLASIYTRYLLINFDDCGFRGFLCFFIGKGLFLR
jgi:hypothetical protein